jgi:hypothetical protein
MRINRLGEVLFQTVAMSVALLGQGGFVRTLLSPSKMTHDILVTQAAHALAWSVV